MMTLLTRFLVLTVIVLSLSACSRLTTKPRLEERPSAVVGNVLKRSLLQQGGELGIVAFKAGSRAEATEELDRISSMIVKGIKETLDAAKTPLKVIDDTQGSPKIVLEGYVQEFSKASRLSGVMLRSTDSQIQLSGELWLADTGQRILNFSMQKRFNPKKQKITAVAYEMGCAIAEYIIEEASL